MSTDRSAFDASAGGSSTSTGPGGIRADKALLRAAAWQLRHDATQDTYRGLQRPEYAYALASVLDLAELRWSDQDDPVRDGFRRCCRVLLDLDDPDDPPGSDQVQDSRR